MRLAGGVTSPQPSGGMHVSCTKEPVATHSIIEPKVSKGMQYGGTSTISRSVSVPDGEHRHPESAGSQSYARR